MSKLTEIVYRPRVSAQTEPPPVLLDHFAPMGYDVVFDHRSAAVVVARHALGREPIVADELTAEEKSALLGAGYKIDPQDGSIVLGDGCFYKQPVELRDQLRAEREEMWRRIDDNEPLYEAIEEVEREASSMASGRGTFGARVEPRNVGRISDHARPNVYADAQSLLGRLATG